MASMRLTTQLQQRMVLTPQLRQRIEMLQMTSLELSELIEQELVANPILEEVQSGDEVQEISDNILDQNANGTDDGPIIDSAASLDSRSEPATDFYTEADAFLPEMAYENGSTD